MSDFCPKTSFATEQYAKDYIQKLKHTSVRQKRPTRTYLCDKCLNWHLTSLSEHQTDVLRKYKEAIKEKNLLISKLQHENREIRGKYNKLLNETKHDRKRNNTGTSNKRS